MGAKKRGKRGPIELLRVRQMEHQVFLGYAAAYMDAHPETSWPEAVRAFKVRFNICGGVSEEYLVRLAAEVFFEFASTEF